MSQRQKKNLLLHNIQEKNHHPCYQQLLWISTYPIIFLSLFSPLTILVLFLFRWIIFISHQFCLHYYYLLYNDKHFSLLNFCTIDSDTTSINSKSFSWSENKLLVEYTQLFFLVVIFMHIFNVLQFWLRRMQIANEPLFFACVKLKKHSFCLVRCHWE